MRMGPACLVALLCLSAGARLAAAQRYPASALILEIDRPHGIFTVSCKAIPGYMDAMVMPIPVHDPKLLDGLQPNTVVDFTLVVTAGDAWAEEVRVHPFHSLEQDPFQARGLQLLENLGRRDAGMRELFAGELVPDFVLTDQTGSRIRFSEFKGRVVAAAFVYTSCPLPNFCFRLSNNLGRLQKRFADRLGTDLVLLSITIDPVRDTPAVLATYAATWKAEPRSWHFLTGPETDVRAVAQRFGVNFWPAEGALTHSLHTIVVDRQGRLAANLEGNEFTAQQLGDLVAKQLQPRP